MDFRAPNIETDDELKQLAREYILQRVCEKYRLKGDPEFDPEGEKEGRRNKSSYVSY